ncbi:hypothetical protein SLE2022_340110 [Rubroshorea leprosula]
MWVGGFVRKNMESCVALGSIFVRYMSRSRAVNVRKINPKVPIEEAKSIAHSLYDIIKQHGPLSISNTWIQAKEAGISGLNSKTHMKIMLKWMRGRKMLKLLCNHVGNNKKFLHCTLPEEPHHVEKLQELNLQTEKPSRKGKRQRA